MVQICTAFLDIYSKKEVHIVKQFDLDIVWFDLPNTLFIHTKRSLVSISNNYEILLLLYILFHPFLEQIVLF